MGPVDHDPEVGALTSPVAPAHGRRRDTKVCEAANPFLAVTDRTCAPTSGQPATVRATPLAAPLASYRPVAGGGLPPTRHSALRADSGVAGGPAELNVGG